MLRTLGGQVDDAGLVAALRRDEPDAAVQLVERYGERIYRLAARITGTPDDAEEAAQSALATAVDTIDTFGSNSSFGAWIDRLAAGAAYRKLLTRLATTGPRETDEIVLEDVLPPLDGGGLHFEPMRDWSDRIDARELQGELRQILTDAVDALRRRHGERRHRRGARHRPRRREDARAPGSALRTQAPLRARRRLVAPAASRTL